MSTYTARPAGRRAASPAVPAPAVPARPPTNSTPRAPGKEERGPQRRLCRRAGEARCVRAEEALLREEVVDQPRREEEGAQEHLLRLRPRVVYRVGVRA